MFNTPDLKPDEILIYLRKSRTDDPGLSVAETVAKHEQMLNDWCMRNLGEMIPEHNRFREVVSGETISARPEMQKVLRLIEQPKYKAILIVEPQRLSRGDLEDIGRLSKLLRYTGTLVITLQYTYDMQDERDRDYFERELKRGNEYLEYSKRIMMNGRNLAAEKGYYLASRRPYGYNRVFRKEGSRRYPTLEIVPEEAEIVRIIFRMYADGNGATNICKYLNGIGVKPLVNDMWSPVVIYDVICNPVYIGKIKWGYRKEIKIVEDGEITVTRPHNKNCPVYDGKHEPIVPLDLWESVQKRRAEKSVPRVNVSKDLQNPLSGVLYCQCGKAMSFRSYHGKCADRLLCPNQTYCDNASCALDDIIDAIINILSNYVSDFKARAAENAGNTGKEETLRFLHGQLAENEKKQSGLWEKYAEGMPKKIFDELLQKAEQQKQEILSAIAEAEEIPETPDYNELVVSFTGTINALRDNSVPAALKNKMLKECIARITYSRKRGTRVHNAKSKGGWDIEPFSIVVQLKI